MDESSTVSPLRELAADARFFLDDVNEAEEAFLPEATDEEVLRHFFCHSDCDDFAIALHRLTGFALVALSDKEKGFLHRLVIAPDGRLLDAAGWTDLAGLAKRYGCRAPQLSAPGGEELGLGATVGDDIDEGIDNALRRAVVAMRHFSILPYSDPAFAAILARPLAGVDFPTPEEEDECTSTC